MKNLHSDCLALVEDEMNKLYNEAIGSVWNQYDEGYADAATAMMRIIEARMYELDQMLEGPLYQMEEVA